MPRQAIALAEGWHYCWLLPSGPVLGIAVPLCSVAAKSWVCAMTQSPLRRLSRRVNAGHAWRVNQS